MSKGLQKFSNFILLFIGKYNRNFNFLNDKENLLCLPEINSKKSPEKKMV